MDKKKEAIAQEIIEGDRDWEKYLTGIFSNQLGLTPEQYEEFQALKTDAEIEAFLNKHSTEDRLKS